MLRLRRYRVFLVFAVVITFVLFRFTQSRDWKSYSTGDSLNFSGSKQDKTGGSTPEKAPFRPAVEVEADHAEKLPTEPTSTSTSSIEEAVTDPAEVASSSTSSSPTWSPIADLSVPQVVIPDKNPPSPTKVSLENENEAPLHPIPPPGRQDFESIPPIPTTIHWVKQEEHFPIPTESIIELPTGAPITIPKIQHSFKDETPDAKYKREKRQELVKKEFQKAWAGYKKHAWKHDELSPVSGNFRDPFCGWAATLVDSLDTLWIMGLEKEFEKAVEAVKELDFTTSPRQDIPMFETTIRYLGGLLAAYDVSGGKYKSILSKAVELAEILMGAFDTPNRMPVLFYRWKPTFASQPHRASHRANLAELGSMSMEFTRLAQLTHEPRYYDAVARITNALSDWQGEGTRLDGVFPDDVDISGCNRTAALKTLHPISESTEPTSSPKDLEEPQGYVATSAESKLKGNGKDDDFHGRKLEYQIIPGEPSKGQILGWNDKDGVKHAKRELDSGSSSNQTTNPSKPTKGPLGIIPAGDDEYEYDGECVPQGLTSSVKSGIDRFNMGGGQDSTYEYFPKQYLLLGGLEEKYSKMYLKTIKAVRKWMLFRPMIPDEDRDVLFSGSIQTAGDPENDSGFTADVTHLTCFIGGMVGMAARIFDLRGDMDLAKKLTDGCVWAYEATSSGIMPEKATVIACENAQDCPWNQTAYWEYLDPMGKSRDENLELYIANKAELEAEDATAQAELARLDALGHDNFARPHNPLAKDYDASSKTNEESVTTPKERLPLRRRQISSDSEAPGAPPAGAAKSGEILSKAETSPEKDSLPTTDFNIPPTEKTPAKKVDSVGSETNDATGSGKSKVQEGGVQVPLADVTEDPLRPLSHKEYVAAQIQQQSLPPGYARVNMRKYILRPEAVESVWYMYRLTGEDVWLEKGWKMFESIIKATSTEYGHSAIFDVTVKEPYVMDQMESFWLAETLKYFYLLYSTPDVISLDEWVLNTEAHPFKRPVS